MSARTKPPFRADHVGSLIRPANLIAAREDLLAGKITRAQLLEIQHAAIRDVVKMQEDLGLRVVTDGEYNRKSWQSDFLLKITNVATTKPKLSVKFQVPQDRREGDAEGHHAFADHPAFPRWPRGDRRQGLSGHGGIL